MAAETHAAFSGQFFPDPADLKPHSFTDQTL
jgi:hypothetical protein